MYTTKYCRTLFRKSLRYTLMLIIICNLIWYKHALINRKFSDSPNIVNHTVTKVRPGRRFSARILPWKNPEKTWTFRTCPNNERLNNKPMFWISVSTRKMRVCRIENKTESTHARPTKIRHNFQQISCSLYGWTVLLHRHHVFSLTFYRSLLISHTLKKNRHNLWKYLWSI